MNEMPTALSDRAQQMLRALIDRYLRDGQPVGSRTLARDAGLQLSPATIRNVMSDLEELGFVSSPHTSAGRVPTVQGYRFFVDTLLSVQPVNPTAVERMRAELMLDKSPHDLVEVASSMLSSVTHLAGVVTLPRHDQHLFRKVEFLSLSEKRVLAILVLDKDEVQNRVMKTDKQYSPAELQQASNYLNQLFVSQNLGPLPLFNRVLD